MANDRLPSPVDVRDEYNRLTAGSKPATTIDEQIAMLASRGLDVSDSLAARRLLENVNYYRLRGYTLTLETGDRFHDGVTLETLSGHYEFDAQLRLVLFSLIAPIETKLNSSTARYLALEHGPAAHLDVDCFKDEGEHLGIVKAYRAGIRQQKNSLMVRYHVAKYDSLPIWAAVEVMSFGPSVRLVGNLKDTRLRKKIYASLCPYKYTYVQSWLESVVKLRNHCAHHNRLFNSNIPATPKLLDADSDFAGTHLFALLVALCRLYAGGWSPGTVDTAIESIQALCARFSCVDISHMSFPPNWHEVLSSNPEYR